MSVSILYDAWGDRACLWCTTSETAFGPVFRRGALEKVEAFLEWFVTGKILDNQTAFDLLAGMNGDGSDPRAFNVAELEKLYELWQDEALDGDDNLLAAAA